MKELVDIEKTGLSDLFECLDAVLHDYFIPYDPERNEESKLAIVATNKMIDLHEAYHRCKAHAHEMNHTFMPMETAPRDGTMVILIDYRNRVTSGQFEKCDLYEGWITDRHSGNCPDRIFLGWFTIPKIPEELIKSTEDN